MRIFWLSGAGAAAVHQFTSEMNLAAFDHHGMRRCRASHRKG
jgi:hypothetical protein